MRTSLNLPLGSIFLLIVVSGCSTSTPASDGSLAGQLQAFRPTATIQDIMDAMIDPGADAIWESVATTVDVDGIHEDFPETDDEWAEVRRSAIRIVEGTNLLLMPGRRVAAAGANSEFPDIELAPEEIQVLIDQDRNKWINLAHGLHDMATVALEAADSRDADALLASGEGLDLACERCHLNYWYPNDSGARQQFEENERYYLEAHPRAEESR